jgi:hypothetical protein
MSWDYEILAASRGLFTREFAVTAIPETVLMVHQNANGYWYIGAGRSIAEGPYREPQQLLAVASDLLAASLRWRIEIFDVSGEKIMGYSSEDTDVSALASARSPSQWQRFTPPSRH